MKTLFAVGILGSTLIEITGCAGAPPPQPIAQVPQIPVDPSPTSAANAPPQTSPDQSAASTSQPSPSVQPVTPPTAVAATTGPKVDFPAPQDLTWVDARGDFALAGEKAPSETGRCEVWNTKTKTRVAQLTSASTAAGGGTVGCTKLSPAGQLVEYQNSRGTYWKNWSNQLTACQGVVAPDDTTCVEDDKTPFYFQGKAGDAADLDLTWSRAIPNGTPKKVATIPRGLNRDGGDPRWWTVQYCSAQKAVIDIAAGHPGSGRITVDARTGSSTKPTKSAGPACP